jgi:RND family efflux transporter MFP subunit
MTAAVLLAACKKEEPPPAYQAIPIARRDIVVSALASGTVQPDTVVEVKSKASGEILDLRVETGQTVKRGDLMVRVDPRTPSNILAQAKADLDVAEARLANGTSQKRRSDELFESQSITEQEHENALLDYANARAEVVRAKVAVDDAQNQMDDTNVRAPISGTIIEKLVERGQVISSPTRDVGGGTVLLRMADLGLVQVRTLVDETDVGKIKVGQRATVTVDAYPNRPFEGTVLKIEPQAITEQNVTMFPVQVRIDNRAGLLRPGMNAEVEIHVGEREDVLAVPNAALRTQRDAGSAAQVLGLSPETVQQELAAQAPARGAGGAATGSAAKVAGGHRTRRSDAPCRRGRRRARPFRRPLVRRPLRRFCEAARRPQAGLDPHRSHRPRLQRGRGRSPGIGFGAHPAEREPGAVAGGVARADQSHHRRGRAPRDAAAGRAGRRGAPAGDALSHAAGRDDRRRLPVHPRQQAARGAHDARHHHRRRRRDHDGGAGKRGAEGG